MRPSEKKERGVLCVMVERVLHAVDIMGKSYDQNTKVTHGKSDVSVYMTYCLNVICDIHIFLIVNE
jgi:hypothetical protein